MEIKELSKKISEHSFSNLYFFYGSEEYLKDFYIDKIIGNIVDKNLECFNFFSYKEPITRNELIDAIDQPPIMAEKKIVYLNNINITKCDQNFKDALLSKLSDIPDFTILLIREIEIDKRAKLFLDLKKKGAVIECIYPKPQDMRAFITREFGLYNKKIQVNLIDKIIEENENSMYSVIHLIKTISGYLQDTTVVTEASINLFINKSIETVVFDLSESLVNKQKKKAYDLLNNLKLTQTKNPPQMLFSLLARHISCLYISLINQNDRIPNSETAKLMGRTPEFIIPKYQKQASNINENKLRDLMIFCADTDYKLKTGQISDPYLGIYSLFAKFWDNERAV